MRNISYTAYYIYSVASWVFLFLLTIERLYSIDIISGQGKAVGISVAIDRIHQGTRVIGVGQPHRVTKLMSSHQEQVVPYG